jgi:uncharacterized protein
MKLLWDEHKRGANLEKHGLDFADLADFGWDDAIIKPARAGKFGGSRSKVVGCYQDGVAIVIFSMLGSEAISIISFRPANKIERRLLDETA